MSAAMTSVAEAEGVGGIERRARVAFSGRYVFRLALLVGLYYGSAKLGYVLEFSGPVAAIVWLPVGVGVAGLSLFGLELLPGALIGDLLANEYSTVPIGAAIGQTCGNMLEVFVAALATSAGCCGGGRRSGASSALSELLGAVALGTLISATIGTISLALAGVVHQRLPFKVARTWWLGDFCGALVIVPLAHRVASVPGALLSRRSAFEGATLIALAAAGRALGARAASRSPI